MATLVLNKLSPVIYKRTQSCLMIIPSAFIIRKKDNIAVELMSCLAKAFHNHNRTKTREILSNRCKDYRNDYRNAQLLIYNDIGALIIAFGRQDCTTDQELNKNVERLLDEIIKF